MIPTRYAHSPSGACPALLLSAASLLALAALASACAPRSETQAETGAVLPGGAADTSAGSGDSGATGPGADAQGSDAGARDARPPCTEPTCVGAPIPTWALTDFNPKSPRTGETYGLDAFEGRVRVVALLAAW